LVTVLRLEIGRELEGRDLSRPGVTATLARPYVGFTMAVDNDGLNVLNYLNLLKRKLYSLQ